MRFGDIARAWFICSAWNPPPQLQGWSCLRPAPPHQQRCLAPVLPQLAPACPAADVLMPDEEIGRAVVHVRDLDISPDAPPADLWLPLQQPVTQRRRRREAKQRAKEQRARRKSRGGATSDGDSSRGGRPGHARRADGAESGDAGIADQGSASSDSEGSEDTQGDDVCVLSRWVGRGQEWGRQAGLEVHACTGVRVNLATPSTCC